MPSCPRERVALEGPPRNQELDVLVRVDPDGAGEDERGEGRRCRKHGVKEVNDVVAAPHGRADNTSEWASSRRPNDMLRGRRGRGTRERPGTRAARQITMDQVGA